MTIQYPIINGTRWSFSSIELTVFGRTYLGFSEIGYTQTVEKGEIYGTSPQKLGDTAGQLKVEGSIGIYMLEDTDLIQAMGDGFYQIPFQLVCSYNEDGTPLRTDTITGCKFKSGAYSHSKGTDGLTVKRDITGFYILEAGVAPVFNLLR